MIEYSWQDLDYEIKSNLDANLPVEFWWRNDDTAYHVNKLKPLAALAKNEGVAVGISTVPTLLTECAKTYILQITNANVLQHGYNHTNHATESERKEELGAHRNTNEVLTELLSGQDKLKLAFDKKLLPVLVPPWNKIETTIVNELPNLGYKGLSCFGSRTRTKNERNIVEVNTHIDVIDFKNECRFIGTGASLAFACQHLANKRARHVDPLEPTGLLTHHQMMDFSSWAFVGAFINRTRSIDGVLWPNIYDIFSLKTL